MSEWQNVEVSSKILGHISAGIYRSPGGAIKELVSNAFDADATRVAITTNWPSFDIITCRDNGSGMTQEKFQQIMTREIGNSAKRVRHDENADDVTNQGRPIIGLLGIGMLGVAQICHEFKVISHHQETQTAFSSRICLADYLPEKVRDTSPDQASKKPINVGRFMIEPIEYESDNSGTYVIASDMRPAFIRKFQATSDDDRLPSKFPAFLEKIHNARSVKSLSDYWQMVWELAVACPIPYDDAGPFDWDKIDVEPRAKKQLIDLQQSLRTYQFEVVVDGLSLRKPNKYPLASPQLSEKERITGKLFSIDENVKVYGQNFKLSGYIYLQNSRAVEPMELRGLLVRIRNVAIGIYDPTLLTYPQIPTPRFNWLSGEIHVEGGGDGGVEFMLNIDRDSFNEAYPHFVKLKEIIHNLLREKIFPEAGRGQRERSQEMRESRENKKQETLKSVIRQELGDGYLLTPTDDKPFPLTIDMAKNIIFKNDQSTFLPKPKKKRELIQLIAHAFEISMEVPEEKRRERFYQLLSEFVKLGLL